MPTPITASRSGTGWTIDVSALSLSTNLGYKDFFIQIAGVASLNTNFTKTSSVLITYTGTSLASPQVITVYRDSSLLITDLIYAEINTSGGMNSRFTQVEVGLEDLRQFVGVALSGSYSPTVVPPSDEAYPGTWNGDTTLTATRNALYDILSTFVGLDSPAFTGNPTAPTQSPGNNSTRLATTAFVTTSFATSASLSSYALLANPTFTGTPSAPTASPGTQSTQLATTAFVNLSYAPLAGPTFTGVPSAPTAANGTNTTQLATTAFITNMRGAANSWGGVQTFSVSPLVPTLALSDVSTAPINSQYLTNQYLVHCTAAVLSQAVGAGATVQIAPLPAAQVNLGSVVNTTTGVFTPTVTGYYRLSGVYSTSAATANAVALSFYQNTTLVTTLQLETGITAGTAHTSVFTMCLRLTASTVYNLRVFSVVAATITNLQLTIEYVSP